MHQHLDDLIGRPLIKSNPCGKLLSALQLVRRTAQTPGVAPSVIRHTCIFYRASDLAPCSKPYQNFRKKDEPRRKMPKPPGRMSMLLSPPSSAATRTQKDSIPSAHTIILRDVFRPTDTIASDLKCIQPRHLIFQTRLSHLFRLDKMG